MARLNSDLSFVGSIGKISAYKRRDLDTIILRYKGGPTGKQIKESKNFENTRRVNKEFGGRSLASRWIMTALWPQKLVADFNIAGPLNALLKPMQSLDTENEWGKRSILLSQHRSLLSGFDLNRKHPFNSIIRNPLHHSILRNTLRASIDIPALLPGINFHSPWKHHPVYSFSAALGLLPDWNYVSNGYQPALVHEGIYPAVVYSDWYPVLSGSPAITLQMGIDQTAPFDPFSLTLAIGIRYGTMGANGTIEQVRYAGSAKVLEVA